MKNIQLLDSRNLKYYYPQILNGTNDVADLSQDNILTISSDTFRNVGFKKLILPSSVKRLMKQAFAYSRIDEIVVPSASLVEENLFYCNYNLKKVILPNNLKVLPDSAFSSCINLCQVDPGSHLERIGSFAFEGCRNLREITLPKTVMLIEDMAFADCGVQKIEVSNITCINGTAFDGTELKYIYNGESVVYSSTKQENLSNYKEYDLSLYYKHIDGFNILDERYRKENSLRDNFIKQLEKENVKVSEDIFFSICSNEKILNEIETLKWYKKLYKKVETSQSYDKSALFKIGLVLGLFKNPFEDKIITKSGAKNVNVDYGQKAYEFLRLQFDRGLLTEFNLNSLFGFVKIDFPFNSTLARFFEENGNFDKLLFQEERQHGFLNQTINQFEEIQSTNLAKNASVRQLAPTVEKFVQYLQDFQFIGVNDENKNIADEVGKFFSEQENFDMSLDIVKEAIDNKAPHHLLNKKLKDEIDDICEIDKTIYKELKKITGHLNEKIENNFSYEWLDKYDPKNLTLGMYCTCCAHLLGAGFGIMRSSIVRNDMQNLVVRNENDEIVAKGTLYVNKKQGYALFNTFEVNDSKTPSFIDKYKVYEKFKKATKDFVDEFNKENPQTPLNKVLVGEKANDLIMFIQLVHEKPEKLVAGVNFKNYFVATRGSYEGDSAEGQYIFYKTEESEIEK